MEKKIEPTGADAEREEMTCAEKSPCPGKFILSFIDQCDL